MKRKYKIFLSAVCAGILLLAVFFACRVQFSGDGMRPPLMMHEGVLYRVSSDGGRVYPEEAEGKGYEEFAVLSSVSSRDLPQKDGESNSADEGTLYYFDREKQRIYLRREGSGARWYSEYLPFAEWEQREKAAGRRVSQRKIAGVSPRSYTCEL